VDDLAQGLRQLLEQHSLRETLARNGRALYEQQFSMPRFFAAIARIHRRHFGFAAKPLRTAAANADEFARQGNDEVGYP
jgi:hypothetical protein